MNSDELTKYIKHYIESDKTNSAIMLTAPWGTGKSYYIQNVLLPSINTGNENNCIIVSLYGLSEISEISKSIYLSAHPVFKKKLPIIKNKELGTAATVATSTIIKGIIGKIGFDFSISDDKLQQLYESLDLSGKLIILEDIERTQIDLLELLGYVNQLVEQDGVKVLLVANEDAILQYEESNMKPSDETIIDSMRKNAKNSYKFFTKETLSYLSVKEKTISDTIIFNGNYRSAITNILLNLDDARISGFCNEENTGEIYNLLCGNNGCNLRTFIFACQKVINIIDLCDYNFSESDIKNIFYSIILFSKSVKSGEFPKWEGSSYLSTSLGNDTYPLYRFCYNYIRWHKFEKEGIIPAIEEHKKLKLYQKRCQDEDLNVLYSFLEQKEENVISSLEKIMQKLKCSNIIPFYEYGKLTSYLVLCNDILDYDYTDVKQIMIDNILQNGMEIDSELLFLSSITFENDIQLQKYEEFKEELLNAIKESLKAEVDTIFDYNPEELPKYFDYIALNKAKIQAEGKYISTLDMDRTIDMLFKCTAHQIFDFRDILFSVYRYSHTGEFIDDDVECMKRMKQKIEAKLLQDSTMKDRIAKYQIRLLLSNLETFISQLS